jgi:hypothetical protein
MEIMGKSTMEKLVRYSTLSYRIAIVRVLWRTIAQNPGTVTLCPFPSPDMQVQGILQPRRRWHDVRQDIFNVTGYVCEFMSKVAVVTLLDTAVSDGEMVMHLLPGVRHCMEARCNMIPTSVVQTLTGLFVAPLTLASLSLSSCRPFTKMTAFTQTCILRIISWALGQYPGLH